MLPIPCVAVYPIIKSQLPTITQLNKNCTQLTPILNANMSLEDIIHTLDMETSNVILDPKGLRDVLIELNNASSLEYVKSQIANYVIYIVIVLTNHKTYDIPHTIISGSGNKYSLISYLARIWKSLGIIKTDKVSSLTQSQLTGPYLAEIHEHVKETLGVFTNEVVVIENLDDCHYNMYSHEAVISMISYMNENETPIIILNCKPELCYIERRFPLKFHLESSNIDKTPDIELPPETLYS